MQCQETQHTNCLFCVRKLIDHSPGRPSVNEPGMIKMMALHSSDLVFLAGVKYKHDICVLDG